MHETEEKTRRDPQQTAPSLRIKSRKRSAWGSEDTFKIYALGFATSLISGCSKDPRINASSGLPKTKIRIARPWLS
jgi:hypothetical protein